MYLRRMIGMAPTCDIVGAALSSAMSAFAGRAEAMCSARALPLVTQLGPPELMYAQCSRATGGPAKMPLETWALLQLPLAGL
jgi:hypothetical protein